LCKDCRDAHTAYDNIVELSIDTDTADQLKEKNLHVLPTDDVRLLVQITRSLSMIITSSVSKVGVN